MRRAWRPTHAAGAAPGDAETFRPQLTSLVDVMTFLLIFLVKTFSVEGDIITPSRNLQLPLSTAEKRPSIVPSIEISQTAIMAEGGVIASIADIQKSRSELITPLFGWMQLQQARSADSLARRQVMIQTDRELPFEIVKRVMYTCSKAGFDDYAILVIQEE